MGFSIRIKSGFHSQKTKKYNSTKNHKEKSCHTYNLTITILFISLYPTREKPVITNKLTVISIKGIKVGPIKKDNPIITPSPTRALNKVAIKSAR